MYIEWLSVTLTKWWANAISSSYEQTSLLIAVREGKVYTVEFLVDNFHSRYTMRLPTDYNDVLPNIIPTDPRKNSVFNIDFVHTYHER